RKWVEPEPRARSSKARRASCGACASRPAGRPAACSRTESRSNRSPAQLLAAIRAHVSYAGRPPENGQTVMTENFLRLLVHPIDDARDILRRLQNNEAFQQYLRKRALRALPLVVGIVVGSFACTGAAAVFFLRAGAIGLLATIFVAPVV